MKTLVASSRPRRFHSCALGVLLAVPLVPFDGGTAHRLNERFPLAPGGDVALVALSPDADWVVYRAAPTDGVQNLYSVPGDLSAPPVLLSDNSSPALFIKDLSISLDSARVLYSIGTLGATKDTVYSVPIDGSAAPVDLTGPHTTTFRPTLDSERVLFLGDIVTSGRFLLCSVPIDGSSGAIVLNAPMPAGTDVYDFALLPDGAHVVYRSDNLYRTSVDTAGDSILLGETVQSGWKVSPDGTRVAFLALQSLIWELYSSPTDGSAAPVRLNTPLSGNQDVEQDIAISPDGERVVYRADQTTDNVIELFSVPIDAASAPTRLSSTPVAGGDVVELRVSVDSTRVVYRADEETDEVFELFGVPIDGSAAPVQLNATLGLNQDVHAGFALGPARVAFLAGSVTAATLFSAPLDGSAAPVVLDGDPDFLLDELAIGANGARAFYVKPDMLGGHLRSVPLDGSAAAVALSGGESLLTHELVLGGAGVLYIADEDQHTVFEAYARPANGSAPALKLNAALPDDTISGSVLSFTTSGERALYVADPDLSGVVGLYSVPVSRATRPILLSLVDGSTVHVSSDIAVGANGALVVFRGRVGTSTELYSVPEDGSSEPVALSGPMTPGGTVEDFRISPDGSRVVYRADQETDGVIDLYRVPIDGSASPVKLSLGTVPDAEVYDYSEMTADASLVIYTGVQDTSRTELYSADGMSPPVKLNDPLAPGGSVAGDPYLSDDGTWVLYRAAAISSLTYELFRVPSDASASPVPLSGTIVAGGSVLAGYRVTPDESRVLFIADREQLNRDDLYSVPADGSTAPVRLNLTGGAGDVTAVLVDPTGTQAIFRYVPSGGTARINRRSVDGSGSQVLLTSGDVRDLNTSNGVPGFQITPDGVLFYMAELAGGLYGLYSRPIDASTPVLRLDDPDASAGVVSFRVDFEHGQVAYVARPSGTTEFRIHVGPTDDSSAPVDPAPQPAHQDSFAQSDYAFAPGGAVLFRYDAHQDAAYDLYAFPSAHLGPVRADPPQRSATLVR